MPIGVMVNSACVFLGGCIGALLGRKLKKSLCESLTLVFGVCSMALGVKSLIRMEQMPAVILSVILGTVIGECLHLEEHIANWASKIQKPVERIMKSKKADNQELFMTEFISVVVLFCASGTGIFGSLQAGMTGDNSILFSKSILDFFTAAIFAASLGYIVAVVAIPQCVIMLILFFSSVVIIPLTTEVMLADFTACGGVLMLATGLRIAGIKRFPIANMIPAMAIVMPISMLF